MHRMIIPGHINNGRVGGTGYNGAILPPRLTTVNDFLRVGLMTGQQSRC